jgi:rhizosphere induced protein
MQSETSTEDAQDDRVRYQVVFVNDSPNTGSACLYQPYQPAPDVEFPGVMSLAWFVKETSPATQVVFDWTMDYCFVWSLMGRLKPGLLFKPGQVLPADPMSTNTITLSKYGGHFSFKEPTAGPRQGSLYTTRT